MAQQNPMTVETLEVWHGGIPLSAPPLSLCTDSECGEEGGHSHTQRISDQPHGIPWRLWIQLHMPIQPDEVVHHIHPGAYAARR